MKIIPDAVGEKPVLKLVFGAMIRTAERWRAVRITAFEQRQLEALREELDQEYEAQTGLNVESSAGDPQPRFSSTSRT